MNVSGNCTTVAMIGLCALTLRETTIASVYRVTYGMERCVKVECTVKTIIIIPCHAHCVGNTIRESPVNFAMVILCTYARTL